MTREESELISENAQNYVGERITILFFSTVVLGIYLQLWTHKDTKLWTKEIDNTNFH